MTNFKGTKGNLVFYKKDYWCGVQIKEPLKSICAVNINVEEHKANALLISKAPEILEILERISNINSNHSIAISDCQEEIEKLIKKATEL